MKPITFENLRRLIGGRRKNKDRNESPFKRSDSFKRISIRRNYLESRGGGGGGGQKGRNPTKKPLPLTDDPQQRPFPGNSVEKTTGDSPPPPVTSLPSVPAKPPDCPLPDLPREDVPPPPPPPPLAERKRRVVTPIPSPPTVTTVDDTAENITAAAAAPVIDYGEWIRCIRAEEDLNNLKRSCSPPTPPARYRYKELDDSSRTDSAISLGRIWMDAPMLPPAAPRSLELPGRPVATVDGDGQQRRAHHSLESALKDKRDDRPVPSRRFHRYPVATAATDKTASRSSVASTCSGKDSGFSLSAPGLSDPPTRPSKQLFRKKAPSRRSAAVTSAPSKPPAPVHPVAAPTQDKLYRVVVSRSPLRQLKLDPMIFVPPEKRRITGAQHHQHHPSRPPSRPVVEIRDYCVPKDARLQYYSRGDGYDNDGDYDYEDDDDDDEQDRLYESISKGSRRWQESTDDADTEDDVQHRHQYQHHYQYQHQYRISESSVAKNRVKRKKSARRNIKYVVKPVRRAPSAASRKPSVVAKSKSSWITTSTSSSPSFDDVY